ncbi:MAG: YqgE/AlgH family protein [Ahrensia sp.]
MDLFSDIKKPGEKRGQFEARFLVSMPDMASDMFAGSVVYICAHSEAGAIGFIVNKPSPMTLDELLTHTELPEEDVINMDAQTARIIVREGGPVEANRGFVLHGADYETASTVNVGNGLYLTSTVQVLRAIASGFGPQKHTVLLGYAGWGRGQLESEMAANSWLVVDADKSLVLSMDDDQKYASALANIGINTANFIGDAGRA